ncbi:hypothetical protein B0H17DRAFT_1142239 [Mycena rosella]|uniref:Uncharacterized protein n=1 Tax=Mycena rosella TaxID=1033263 RepID=A0AAD7CXW3_MYCRO|nr:hypothetical protein B0H17DRAFT_1142239 [Mycena rosella]
MYGRTIASATHRPARASACLHTATIRVTPSSRTGARCRPPRAAVFYPTQFGSKLIHAAAALQARLCISSCAPHWFNIRVDRLSARLRHHLAAAVRNCLALIKGKFVRAGSHGVGRGGCGAIPMPSVVVPRKAPRHDPGTARSFVLAPAAAVPSAPGAGRTHAAPGRKLLPRTRWRALATIPSARHNVSGVAGCPVSSYESYSTSRAGEGGRSGFLAHADLRVSGAVSLYFTCKLVHAGDLSHSLSETFEDVRVCRVMVYREGGPVTAANTGFPLLCSHPAQTPSLQQQFMPQFRDAHRKIDALTSLQRPQNPAGSWIPAIHEDLPGGASRPP